jgi:hypothetical protein
MPQNSNVSFFQDLTNQEGEPPACFPLNVTGAENIFFSVVCKICGFELGWPTREATTDSRSMSFWVYMYMHTATR